MRANDPDLLERHLLGADEAGSCVSLTGPVSELSIGRTPKATWPSAVASTTAVKLGSGTRSAPAGKRLSQAAALCAPSRPG
jgi:hypothetical protein